MGLEDAAGLDDVPELDNVTGPELDNVMGLDFSASQIQSIIFQKQKNKSVLAPLAVVAEPERVGRVVAVLAWVGTWPLIRVEAGVLPSFTALQTNPASGVMKHWVLVGQQKYPGSFGR